MKPIKNILDTREISDAVMEIQHKADKEGIEFNAINVYQVWYKREESYKHLIGQPSYQPMMYGKIMRTLDMVEKMYKRTKDESS